MKNETNEMGEMGGSTTPMESETLMTAMRTTYTVATLDVPRDVYDAIKDRLKAAGYSHTFMEPDAIDLSGVAIVPSDSENWHLSKDGAALVGKHVFKKIEPGMPRGKKCLLLGPGRVATLAFYDGDIQWTHYFEMPDVPEDYVDVYWKNVGTGE
jgi:hypothetical protein